MEPIKVSKRLSRGQSKMVDLYLRAKGCAVVVVSEKDIRVHDPDTVIVLEGDCLDNAKEWDVPRRDTTVRVVTNKNPGKWFRNNVR